jgi:hypothetical protein
MLWGEDVMTAIDRGLAVAAFAPSGRLLGQWAFSLDETPGVQLAPTPFALRGEVPCAVLRPGQQIDVTAVLSEGTWLATVEGTGRAVITMDTPVPPSEWKHRLSNGRGEAAIQSQSSQLLLEPVPATRSIFRFSMPPKMLNVGSGPIFQHSRATLEPGDITAVRVCQATIPTLPATGAFEVGADRDAWFGPGWHLGERGGTQRFRWSERTSNLTWRMDKAAPLRMLLHLRPASAAGSTIHWTINGAALPSCKLPAGAWTDCKLEISASQLRADINQLTLAADTISPSSERPGDPRELSFVMQASRVRIGQ